MKITEAVVNQITEIPKLRYLLINLAAKYDKVNTENKANVRKLTLLNKKYEEVLQNYKKLMESTENSQIHMYDVEFERMRADFNQNACVFLTKLLHSVDNSSHADKAINSISDFTNELKEVSKSQQDHFQELMNQKNAEIMRQQEKINELVEITSAPISKEVEKLINDKDESISNLKEMLQRAQQSDKMKQEQIEAQLREIDNLQNSLKNSSAGNTSVHLEKIARLEMRNAELEEKIVGSNASRTIETKNERLAAMLEKSNRLYSQLQERYNILEKETSTRSKIGGTSPPVHFDVPKIPTHKLSGGATRASLRKTLLQFFLCDPAQQVDLIPVVLGLVDCNQEQVATVVRKHQEQSQLINRTGGFFGLFK